MAVFLIRKIFTCVAFITLASTYGQSSHFQIINIRILEQQYLQAKVLMTGKEPFLVPTTQTYSVRPHSKNGENIHQALPVLRTHETEGGPLFTRARTDITRQNRRTTRQFYFRKISHSFLFNLHSCQWNGFIIILIQTYTT